MKERKRPEVLAPAGSREKLETALLYGADAVYLAGQQFGLRAFAANFSPEELSSAVDYVHARGKKVYVTANIYAHQEDLAGLPAFFEQLESLQVDGIILADPGVFRLATRYAPSIPKQISTQASLTNVEACLFWYDLGVRRVVLARELTLDEIRSIRQALPADMELETFVHGAMCMSYSGRCLLSNYLVERDGNRGKCAQPCRWKYKVVDQNHPDKALEMEEDARGTYLFSSNDLWMIEHIPALIEAGVDSFKIEGRMKGAYYAGIVTKAYREAVDAYFEGRPFSVEQAKEELSAMVHRPFATGFYFDKPSEKAQIFSQATYMKEAVVLGIVKKEAGSVADAVSATGTSLPPLSEGLTWLPCEQRNKICVEDDIQFIRPKGPPLAWKVQQLCNEQGEALTACPHPKMTFFLSVPTAFAEELQTGCFLRRLGDKDQDPDSLVREHRSCDASGCSACQE